MFLFTGKYYGRKWSRYLFFERTIFHCITTCGSDVECGGPGIIRKTMSIDVEEGGADDYYLKVVLSYDGLDIESPTTKSTYKISGKTVILSDLTEDCQRGV